MLNRLKKALVDSFVGAVALGWLFSQGVLHFAYVFSAPVAGWVTRRLYRGLAERTNISTGFTLQDALPELVRSVSLLLVAYLLLRWLYYKPLAPEVTQPEPQHRA